MEYWWVALIIVAIGALMGLLTWLLRNNRKVNMIVLLCIATALLIYKTHTFIIARQYHQYPIEFSHMSYFIFSVTVIVGSKKLRPFAALCAFLSGAGFLIAGIFAPDSIVNDASSTMSWVTSIIQHEALLLGGLLLIFNCDRYDFKESWIPALGIFIMCIFSILVYNRILYPDLADRNRDNMVIIFILGGTILRYLLPDGTVIPMWGRALTIIGELILIALALWGFYRINNKAYDKKIKNCPQFEGKGEEYSLIALVKYIIEKVNEKKAMQTENKGAITVDAKEGVASDVVGSEDKKDKSTKGASKSVKK